MLWDGAETTIRQPQAATSWSPDGQFVLVNGYSPSGKAASHIWKLPVMPERSGPTPKPSIYLDTGSFTETDGHFSPDGRWVVYSSNESQRYEVYVTAFPDSRGKRQISIDGGITPRWRGDGKEIYYIDPNSTLMAAEIINKGGSLEVGQIRPVARGFINQRGYLFDASKDGTRFLSHVLRGAPREDAFSEPLTLISNWPALLKK